DCRRQAGEQVELLPRLGVVVMVLVEDEFTRMAEPTVQEAVPQTDGRRHAAVQHVAGEPSLLHDAVDDLLARRDYPAVVEALLEAPLHYALTDSGRCGVQLLRPRRRSRQEAVGVLDCRVLKRPVLEYHTGPYMYYSVSAVHSL